MTLVHGFSCSLKYFTKASWQPLLASVLLCLLSACTSHSHPMQTSENKDADIVILDAAVYTMNSAQPWAQALAIADQNIVFVGNDAEAQTWIGPATKVIKQQGAMVLPGIHDSHVHPVWAGLQMALCDLADIPTIELILARVEQCAKEQTGEWLLGGGYNPVLFPKSAPHKSLLDAIVPERIVFFDDADGHGAWLNSKALAHANITATTPVPEGSVIELDETTGEPAGTLREGAINLIRALAPAASLPQRIEAMERAQQLANSLGITSLIAAQATPTYLEPMHEMAKDDRLTVNILASLHYGGEVFEKPSAALVANRKAYEGGRLTTHSAKIYADGVLEGGTAAMLEPYFGFGHHGSYQVDPETLKKMVQELDAQNVQAHIHAIGDAGIRAALDAIEFALNENGKRDNRHHISHVQVVHPDDIARFAELNVTANFQSLWAYPDEYITEFNLPELGQSRVDQMYPLASIQRAGGRIVGGSDWSVSTLNPFLAMETAITREDANGDVEGTLNANESVDIATMLEAYTINTAFLMKHEDLRGSLEVGKRADVTIINQNLFKIPAQNIGDTKVLYTMLDGKIVFEKK